MSVETKLKELFAEAFLERRDDVLGAISPFMTIPLVISQLNNTPELFGKRLMDGLRRSSYSLEDLREMFGERVRSNIKGYPDFLKSLATHPMDESSRSILIKNYMSAGFYEQALQAFSLLDDKDAFAKDIRDTIKAFTHPRYHNSGLFIIVGEPDQWNVDAIRMMDAIGVNIEDEFTSYSQRSRHTPWRLNRFHAQVNLVGTVCESLGVEVPRLTMRNGQAVFTKGAELAEAFRREAENVHTAERQGGWHSRNFPRYLPVQVGSADIAQVSALNGVLLKPKTSIAQPNGGVKPHHGFAPETDQVSAVDVAKAMTLLSNEKVSQALLGTSGHHLALIPAEAIPNLQIAVDPDLSMAMRYHRPEVVAWMAGDRPDEICMFHEEIGTQLYLRGAVLDDRLGNAYVHMSADFCDPDNLALFVTRHEHDFACQYFKLFGDNNNPYRVDEVNSIVFVDNTACPEDGVKEFLRKLEVAFDYLGFTPAVTIKGSLEFLEKLSWQKLNAPIENVAAMMGDGKLHTICGKYGISLEPRMSARLGACPDKLHRLYGNTPEQQLQKAIRLKDPVDCEKIKGLLDRLDPIELAGLAKTEKQVEFLVENFDFKEVMGDLPANIRKRFSRKQISTDMGL